MTDEINDSRAYRQLLSACDGWSVGKQAVLDLLDTGEHWPSVMPKLPLHVFERSDLERSRDYATADRARRERRQRAARVMLRIMTEQASSLSELAVLRMNMSPTATGGFSCCAEPRSIERNLRFVRGLCLTPT
ncbi:MAG TPA: hypothetical protein VJY15_09465, partial [Candidatus Acidoferrum sp.]|nr:hypothetical protein [Candidatus Acidoferrum sp.]